MSNLRAADESDPEAAILFAEDRERLGYVANYTRLFANRPEVYRAWQALNGAIKAGMDPVRYEVATLAVAKELRSSYCSLAHGSALAKAVGVESAVEIVQGRDTDPVNSAISELARKVATEPAGITDGDLAALREVGMDDTDILDVILAAAARCFFSGVLEATGTEPDGAYAMLDERLRTTLTVGRPIEASSPSIS